jgi:hypothetical protein
MEKFNAQLSMQLKVLEKEKQKKTFACFKCGDPTHNSSKCPHSKEEAKRLKKERQMAAKAAVSTAAANGSESD